MKLKRIPVDIETQKRLQIALMLLEIPDYEAAIDQLDKVIKINPENPTANLLLANTYIESSDPKKAIPFLTKVLAQQPDNQEALFSLGQALSWAGKHEQARPILEKLAEQDPVNPDVLDTLWHTYIDCKEIKLAEDIFHRLIQTAPDEFAIYEVMHYRCLDHKYFDQAIQVAQYMAEKAPIATYLNILGETLLKAGKPEQAKVQFEKALKDEDDFEPAWAYLAQSYRDMEQPQRAIQIAEQGLDKHPNSLNILEQKAQALMDLQEWEQSLALIDAIINQMNKGTPARLDALLMYKFFTWQHIHSAESACQMAVDLLNTYAKYLNEHYPHYYLLIFLLTETMRELSSNLEVIGILESIPIEELILHRLLPSNYYLALIALDRFNEAGEFLQKLATHPEIEIDTKTEILKLIEQSSRDTLATDQPETFQAVLQQIRELNILPEAIR